MLLLQRKNQRRLRAIRGLRSLRQKVRPERATSASARSHSPKREFLLCFLNCERVSGLARSPKASRRTDLAPSAGGSCPCSISMHHTRFADATAELMRSCAVAAAQTMTVSACRGLTLWSDILRPPDRLRVSQLSRPAAANPFEVFWRFSPMRLDAEIRRLAAKQLAAQLHVGPGLVSLYRLGKLALRRLAHVQRLVHLEPSLLVILERSIGIRERLHPAGSGDAGGAARHLAVRLRQLSIGRRARRGADHHARQDTAVASLTTTAALTQMQTMLGMWRAALGA